MKFKSDEKYKTAIVVVLKLFQILTSAKHSRCFGLLIPEFWHYSNGRILEGDKFTLFENLVLLGFKCMYQALPTVKILGPKNHLLLACHYNYVHSHLADVITCIDFYPKYLYQIL